MINKTITPVISVILLIMLTIAVSATAWYWVNGLQANLEDSTAQGVEEATEMGTVRYNIISAVCNTTGGINLTIQNNGLTDITAATAMFVTLKTMTGITAGTKTVTVGSLLDASNGIASIGEIFIPAVNGTLPVGETYQISTDIAGTKDSYNCLVE
jgi:hypothetical protein